MFPGPWQALHGVLLNHPVVVRVGVSHVPVVVHLGQVHGLAGHVQVVKILEGGHKSYQVLLTLSSTYHEICELVMTSNVCIVG